MALLVLVWIRISVRSAICFLFRPFLICSSRRRSMPSFINSNAGVVSKVDEGFVEYFVE